MNCLHSMSLISRAILGFLCWIQIWSPHPARHDTSCPEALLQHLHGTRHRPNRLLDVRLGMSARRHAAQPGEIDAVEEHRSAESMHHVGVLGAVQLAEI